ncbi:hypothetical protein [Sneathiella sp.]|uniref:hypothetical protein n=1 Tax=Sneathiella sp. TaxID=1964365 RepID=UPI00356460FF
MLSPNSLPAPSPGGVGARDSGWLPYWWDYAREQTHYQAAYSEHFGVPKGAGPVSKGLAKKQNQNYVIIKQRRRMVRKEHVTVARKLM